MDGSKYEGNLKNGMRHGKGAFVNPDGNIFIGK